MMIYKMKSRALISLVFFLCLSCKGNTIHREKQGHVKAVKGRPFFLKGRVRGDLPSDTITLSFWKHFIRRDMGRENFTVVAERGEFSFELPALEHPGYFSLNVPGHSGKMKWDPLLKDYLASPGDSIMLDITRDGLDFTGRGSEKYTTRYAMDQAVNSLERPDCLNVVRPENLESMISWLDFRYTVQQKALEMRRGELKESAYQLLHADLSGKRGYRKYFAYWIRFRLAENDDFMQKRFLRLFREGLLHDSVSMRYPGKVVYSRYFTEYLVRKERIDKGNGVIAFGHRRVPIKEEYKILKEKYSGLLREKLLTYYLANNFTMAESQQELEYCLRDALSLLSNEYFREMIRKLYENQKKGAIPFNFALPDTLGKIVRLSDFKGKLVFLDFWFTGCGPCLMYAKTLLKVHEAFKYNPAVVFVTISVDREESVWKKSVRRGKNTSPGAINLYTGGKGIDHPIIDHYNIKGYPYPIIIDREGKIYKSSGLRLPAEDLVAIVNKALKQED